MPHHYIDAHVHLLDPRLDDLSDAIDVWLQAGNRVLDCAIEEEQWKGISKGCISNSVDGALGIHPWYADRVEEGWEERLETLVADDRIVAVGECGLDKQLTTVSFDTQVEVLQKQLRIAQKVNKSVVLHCLKSWTELFALIDEIGLPEKGGVVHSFGGSKEIAIECIKRDLSLSFNGHLLNEKNRKIQKTFEELPLDSILLETDSPAQYVTAFTASQDVNVPMNVEAVYAKAASLRDMELGEFCTKISSNYHRLFGNDKS